MSDLEGIWSRDLMKSLKFTLFLMVLAVLMLSFDLYLLFFEDSILATHLKSISDLTRHHGGNISRLLVGALLLLYSAKKSFQNWKSQQKTNTEMRP